jgi:superfamily II DNA or RNA helicase
MSFIPSLSSIINEETDYKIIGSCNIRLKTYKAAPEKILLCKHEKKEEYTIFWFHLTDKKELTFEEFFNYTEEYKNKHQTNTLPQTLSDMYHFLLPFHEKKQLEKMLNSVSESKSTFKL